MGQLTRPGATARPTIARSGLIGRCRPDPREARWSPADLARRRSHDRALQEFEDARARNDPPAVLDGWAAVIVALRHAVGEP